MLKDNKLHSDKRLVFVELFATLDHGFYTLKHLIKVSPFAVPGITLTANSVQRNNQFAKSCFYQFIAVFRTKEMPVCTHRAKDIPFGGCGYQFVDFAVKHWFTLEV